MIYIIIPVHNRINNTIKCLNSIYEQEYDNIQIIIIDDGSTDGTKQIIEDKYSEVTVLNGTGSLFWTGAVHYGVNYILSLAGKKDDWVLLINNDVVITEGVIDKLIAFSENKNRNVIVNALSVDLNDKNTIIKSGTKVKSWALNITKHIYHGDKISELVSKDAVEADLLTGRCLLHPIEVFWAVGNYNSKLLPHYGADDEFTARAKRSGYALYILPNAVVYLDNDEKKSNMNILEMLFGVRSSINLINKWRFAKSTVPVFALPTYYFIAILKSLFILFKSR